MAALTQAEKKRIRAVIVPQFLASGDGGRHKVYVLIFHPLKNRTEYAARQAGLPVPEMEMLPEPDFWALIGKKAAETGATETDTLFSLIDQTPDMTQKPAHPFWAR